MELGVLGGCREWHYIRDHCVASLVEKIERQYQMGENRKNNVLMSAVEGHRTHAGLA